MTDLRIDIGGGTVVNPGWTNLDPVHGQGIWKRPAQVGPWPAETGTVAAVRASHVLEHIPAGAERIFVLNEAWRALRPGGTFEIIVPLLVSASGEVNWQAIADPTHVSWWCEESFAYFDGRMAANAQYGIKRWDFVEYDEVGKWQGRWVGRKPL